MNNSESLHLNILSGMKSGVLCISFEGVVRYANDSACRNLSCLPGSLDGKSLAEVIRKDPENTALFADLLLCLSDTENTHEKFVTFHTGSNAKEFYVTTSFLYENGEKTGITLVLDDTGELGRLRDAVHSAEHARALNATLKIRNELLSKTFGRYLSDEIVRQIMETPGGLEMGGNKMDITVLMSDLRGFTAMSEQMDAPAFLDMLNHYLGEMTDAIHRYRGTIIEFIGDSILAIFGTPIPCSEHAEYAVAAAVEMESRIGRVNQWNAKHGYPDISMGIGINTGEAIVGNIGSDRHAKFGVTGSLVNICGRIESVSVGGQILASPETIRRIRSSLSIRQTVSVFPKGTRNELELTDITGIGAPYHLSCAARTEDLLKLAAPVSVSFSKIMPDKTISSGKSWCTITELSGFGAVLNTDTDAKPLSDLCIYLPGDEQIACKIISRSGNELTVRFTSVPESFPTWYQDAVGNM